MRAVAVDNPLASSGPACSSSSAAGSSRNSPRSFLKSARSVSRWVLTDTYSPNAIDTAPAANPAIPAVRIGPRATVAAATPTTMPAVETIPSLAPKTPARSQLSLDDTEPACGSAGCDALDTIPTLDVDIDWGQQPEPNGP